MTSCRHSSIWPSPCLFGCTLNFLGVQKGVVLLPVSQLAQRVAEIPYQADQPVLLI